MATKTDRATEYTSHDGDPIVLDPEMRRIFGLLSRVAATRLPVLVLGETGSGKEGAAEWVHRHSTRASGPLVRVNCASLSESMVESELFGHERGAFTGANTEHQGYFEAASGGTLLLDEIGELSLRVQAKLLRVLERGEIVRVGSTQPRRVDVRLVAATHRDLPALVARGEFREDLYFRLDGLRVTLPGLRDRKVEILPLARLFLRRGAAQLGVAEPILGDEAASALLEHGWAGNVRELRNVIARAIAFCPGGVVQPEHFAFDRGRPTVAPEPPPSEASKAVDSGVRSELRAFEKNRILDALERTGGNQTRAAQLLGFSRRTLTNKLNAYAIERPRKRTVSGTFPAPGR